MTVAEAQQEVRSIFVGGAVGQVVSGTVWLVSAALATWLGARQGILALVLGGMFIFPLTQLTLRALGRPWKLSPANPLGPLAMQIAFIVPLTLPVVGAAALHNINWFYPSCAVIVGAHYLPFIFLYGMRQYAVLATALIGGGLALGITMPQSLSPAGWFGGVVLVLFAAWIGIGRRTKGT